MSGYADHYHRTCPICFAQVETGDERYPPTPLQRHQDWHRTLTNQPALSPPGDRPLAEWERGWLAGQHLNPPKGT